MAEISGSFLQKSRDLLVRDYLPKLECCLDRLTRRRHLVAVERAVQQHREPRAPLDELRPRIRRVVAGREGLALWQAPRVDSR
jgi:hypothetical protein